MKVVDRKIVARSRRDPRLVVVVPISEEVEQATDLDLRLDEGTLGYPAQLAVWNHGWIYDVALGLQLGVALAALAGVGIARYYVLVTWATLVALWNCLRRGVPATWDVAEGTR